jgi:hypothetical protein
MTIGRIFREYLMMMEAPILLYGIHRPVIISRENLPYLESRDETGGFVRRLSAALNRTNARSCGSS